METLSRLLLIGWMAAIGSVLAVGCDNDNDGDDDDDDESLSQDDLLDPGRFATDKRVPELPDPVSYTHLTLPTILRV